MKINFVNEIDQKLPDDHPYVKGAKKMERPDKNWFKRQIKTIKKNSQTLDQYQDLFSDSFLESLYRVEEVAVTALMEVYGDQHEWISWFIYENEYGADKRTVEIDGEEITVSHTSDIWEVMAKDYGWKTERDQK